MAGHADFLPNLFGAAVRFYHADADTRDLVFDDTSKELGFSGIYRLTAAGDLTLLEDRVKAQRTSAF